ncbi:3-methyladenine DNA glycosylase [Haloferula sp. A504]|uniref:3-methyladenine DNA glycosylase n=1 Tax=Haloferula sp. A504 TaxID=3373601 RepID=UPI0031C086B6|nr:hypothetical protein [Verrucomicrobiaceae bacterium E54]
MSATEPIPVAMLSAEQWRRHVGRHREQVRRKTTSTRNRKAAGRSHPVEDFLFTYYFISPTKLEQWHPGAGIVLENAADLPDWLSHPPYLSDDRGTFLPETGPPAKARERLRWILDLLVATRGRAPNFSCHGLHEWAMVYTGTDIRHRESCPLRLPQAEIDALVESRPICCSHFDAFRFFHADARPLNRLQPTLDLRQSLEQPGCLHANMDLYKWTGKAMPWVGSELLFETFELALELRELDMRASPYDLSAYGLDPVPIETEAGRADYVRQQQALAEKAAPLRQRLIDALQALLSPPPKIA